MQGWSDWSNIGGVLKQIAVGVQSDGNLVLFGIGEDGELYRSRPNAAPSTCPQIGAHGRD